MIEGKLIPIALPLRTEYFNTLQKYLVKMTTSAWLLQFKGSLNRLHGSMIKEFQNAVIIHQPQPPHYIPSSFKELAQTLVS